MARVDKQLPHETLEILLKHKKEVLDNISTHYRVELDDASADSEKLFKYGFIFVGAVETVIATVAGVVERSSDALLFVVTILFLTVAISAVLYERIRIEKAELRHHANSEREPIMQQIILLKGFLEPEEPTNV